MKVSPEILNMTPYRPGKPISETQREYGLKTVYKLASNENPLGPSPKALAAVREALAHQHFYPDPSAYELLSVLSRVWNVPRECLSIGNGSDEIIDLLTRIYCEAHDSVLTSKAAFQAYQVSSVANRLKLRETALTKDWRFDLEAIADDFLSHPEQKIRLIFIANPNNPTGTHVTKSEMDKFFQRLGGRDDVLLVFDEAYNEFARAKDYASAMDYVGKVSNLVVLRTFSKAYGLAGFRVGALVAPKEVVEIYNRVRKPFNVNDLAQIAAAAAVEDTDFIRDSQKITWEGLDYFSKELDRLGLKHLPSQGNFVLFDTERDALKVYEALLRRGIIMRPVVNYGLPKHLRLSVGRPEENIAAIKALEEVLAEVPKS
ncbi:MAG: histidinol-phosphate transaminase [Bdellovibrionaceae bacterium]|nr:histidinol-phosphate transaminase [Pseudobdellovibrionaceae bacterium]